MRDNLEFFPTFLQGNSTKLEKIYFLRTEEIYPEGHKIGNISIKVLS